MDNKTIRERINEAAREEALHEKLRAHWASIRGNWTELLQMQESPTAAIQPHLLSVAQPTALPNKDSAPSIRMAILQVLREANGRILHANEIAERVSALGVTINAGKYRTAMNLVDFTCYSLRAKHHVEKQGPRLWRWSEGDEPLQQSAAMETDEVYSGRSSGHSSPGDMLPAAPDWRIPMVTNGIHG